MDTQEKQSCSGASDTFAIEGGCLCGAVRYRTRAAPITAVHCHCTDCRRASGAAFSTIAIYPRDAVEWIMGQPRRVPWAGRLRLSCAECGSPLGTLPSEDAAVVALTAGSHDQPEALKPACHVWDSDRLPFIKIDDGLPRHLHMMPA